VRGLDNIFFSFSLDRLITGKLCCMYDLRKALPTGSFYPTVGLLFFDKMKEKRSMHQ
jgi:hypothetical protein